MRSKRYLPMRRLPTLRGGNFMMPSSAGSMAVTNPRVIAHIRLEYNTWMGERGLS